MNIFKSTYILIIIVLLLASCHIGKEYIRPKPDTSKTFRSFNVRVSEVETISIGSVGWKDFFTDTSLQELIDSVLIKNYDMSTALNNIRLNDEYLKQSKVAWLPSVSSNISAGSNRFSDNSLNGRNGLDLTNGIGHNHLEDYSVNLGVNWELDIWGKIKNKKEAALAYWLQSKEAKNALRTRLISSTASAYYNLLMLHKQLEIANKNLALNDSIVKIVRLQMENGETTTLAVQQAEVQQKNTASFIPEIEKALGIQENALSILMSRQPSALPITQDLSSFIIPEDFKTGIPVSLLSHRPDIKESELVLRAANARIGVAKANMYPALSINAAGGMSSFQADTWLVLPTSLFRNAAVNLLQPVFNKRQLRTQLNVSKIEYEQAVINFKSKLLNAAGEVSEVLMQLEKLKEKIEIYNSQNLILKKAVPNSQQLFRNGMVNYLEVIIAQQGLLKNELESADLKRKQITAYIQLYRSLGGGVQ